MKHLKASSQNPAMPIRAHDKGAAPIMDPCAGLTGWQRKKCEFKAYKGGVVY